MNWRQFLGLGDKEPTLEELRKGLKDSNKIEIEKLMELTGAMSELERRIHEIEFHGRKGDAGQLQETINIGRENLTNSLIVILNQLNFNYPKTGG